MLRHGLLRLSSSASARAGGGKRFVPAYAAEFATQAAPSFHYQELFDLAPDQATPYRKLTSDYVSTFNMNGQEFLKVEPEADRKSVV